MKDNLVIGAMSTGGGVAPLVRFPGLEPSKLVVDGKPANAEDLCSSYALRTPYEPQHGDDLPKWIAAYGGPPEGRGTGLDESPKSTKQLELDAAIRLCDKAIGEAARRNELICVVVVDRHGDVVQIDRMDHAAPMSPDAAEALAVTAVNFRAPSSAAANYPNLDALASVTPFKYLPVPGGLPLRQGVE
ncbi:heme-binding protein [Streptomyces sp. NPDC029044]|uniref:GlcG/HbpS family heme-binding protein n=1 Tax=Streptomyces sp. NPDC029044 TaxID=3157198 RepID=UPI0033D8367D